MDKYTSRLRVRDAHGDDVKATTIKEIKAIEKQNKFLVYMEMFPSQNLI